jgi:DNA-binding response OmpR family regulator
MKKKILIVDQNEDFRKFTKSNLEQKGYEILEASSAKDGLDMAVRNAIDLVMMDMWLPSRKRGIDTAQALRNTEKTKDLPILFLTGSRQEAETRDVAEMTKCGYISKPFDMKSLERKIEQCMK